MNNNQYRNTISLWFDHQAEEAAKFYTTVFSNAKMGDLTYYGKAGHEIHGQQEGTVLTAAFNLSGLEFMALNGGPLFKINPSISFFVVCETAEETNETWKKLLEGGQVLMPLDKYEWSEQYGWLQDRYGVSWQIALGKISDVGQKVTPSFLFTGQQHGKAEEAIQLYTSIFKPSGITGILKYEKGEEEKEGTVKHAQFHLEGQQFMAMDSEALHKFTFNEAVSIMVPCDTQYEIDYYWNSFTAGGGQESQCGWLKDKFGVSWQITWSKLEDMLKDRDREKVERVTAAFMKMQKFDIATLEKAFNGK